MVFSRPRGAAWHLLAPFCSSAAGWVSSASPSAVPLKKTNPGRAGANCALSCCFPGQSGLGKSTLINTLFKSKISRKSVQPTAEERIPKTIEIKSITHGEAPQSPAGTLAFGPALPPVPPGLGGAGDPPNLHSHLHEGASAIQRCSRGWEDASLLLPSSTDLMVTEGNKRGGGVGAEF